jgi:hypothetical protein
MSDSIPPVVAELVGEFYEILSNLKLPEDDAQAQRSVERLTEYGCEATFLLQVSFLYAYTAMAFRKNAQAETSTPSGSRLIALPGLGMSRRELANHVRDVRHVARQIQRIVAVARKPGKDQETLRTAAELATLPDKLERYCRFAIEVGRACSIPREKRLQRDRFLCSLVAYVRACTGKPHWESLVALINTWKLVNIQGVETLRVQFDRANRPGQLPLLWPTNRSGQASETSG